HQVRTSRSKLCIKQIAPIRRDSGTIVTRAVNACNLRDRAVWEAVEHAAAWNRRVMADEVMGHAFSHGFHPLHVERLAAYWAEALGGPSMYSESYGDETAVVRIHSGNGVHDEMDRRAIACFDQALADVGLADDSALRQVLHDYFAWATTTTMARYHRS